MINSQIGFVFDSSKCFGCHSCEVACKNENHLSSNISWRKLIEVDKFSFVTISCNHCSNPECSRVCPENAFIKREDGIVVMNEELCTGCRLCESACPFGAITFNYDTLRVSKCEMCVTRIDAGLLPACVSACSTKALTIKDFYSINSNEVQRQYKNFPDTLVTSPSLLFVKEKPKETKKYFISKDKNV